MATEENPKQIAENLKQTAQESRADIQENEILSRSPHLLRALLCDHTLTDANLCDKQKKLRRKPTADERETLQVNIFWATHNYSERGEGYGYADQITLEAITGDNGNVIVPRSLKSRQQQQQRSREMAEVFTPSWICNKQNNLIDTEWFGRENVFNTETDRPDGSHDWLPTVGNILFPEGKSWMDYVTECRLEITCGEAPYLVSRYDTVTGEMLPVERRIGLLDRKLRVVGENTEDPTDWLTWALRAFQATYGYEWQGDNLILARENLLYTFIDHYQDKFGCEPSEESLEEVANVISWNLVQMDGLKFVVPNTCFERKVTVADLFGVTEQIEVCEGCKNSDPKRHNGTYVQLMDWETGKKIRFIDLIK